MILKAGFQEKLLFFSFFGVWGFSLSRYLIQAAISGASRHLSKNARQTGDTISSNINTLNSRYRKGALEGGKGLKLDHVKPCVIPHITGWQSCKNVPTLPTSWCYFFWPVLIFGKNTRKQAKTRENRRKTGAFLVLIFLGEKLVGANFYAFCNYGGGNMQIIQNDFL